MFLMNKDKKLARLEVYKDKDGYEKVAYLEKFTQLPFWLDNIDMWFRERMSVGRIHIGQIYDAAGIVDINSFIELCNAASINDTLWIKEENSNKSWEQVNLFKLKFNASLATYCISGEGLLDNRAIRRFRSPEYTTVGSYDKCWKRENGAIILWKKGLEKWSEASGNEPLSEYYSSIIERDILGLTEYRDYIPYEVMRYDDKYLISKCKCFTSEDIGFIPMYLVENNTFSTENFMTTMYSINKYSGDLFRRMAVLDYITLNTDRHIGNFGCLIDNHTLEIKRMAPIFDNNLALYPKVPIIDKELANIISDLRLLRPRYENSFKDILNIVLDDNIKNTIRKRFYNWKGFNSICLPDISNQGIQLMNLITKSRINNILKR